MHWRVMVVVLCVCVCLVRYHASCCILHLQVQNCGVIRFLMAFQRHDLCEFLRNRFVRQFWRHLLIPSFLTFVRLAVA